MATSTLTRGSWLYHGCKRRASEPLAKFSSQNGVRNPFDILDGKARSRANHVTAHGMTPIVTLNTCKAVASFMLRV